MLTAEENGRIYHIVKKSKVLDRNLKEYFEYKGPIIYFKFDKDGTKDSIIDYDSIVNLISLEPSILKIDHYALSHASTGLLAELSSKMALYALYSELKSRNEPYIEGTSDKAYQYFIDTLTIKLPNGVIRKKNGKNQRIKCRIIMKDMSIWQKTKKGGRINLKENKGPPKKFFVVV